MKMVSIQQLINFDNFWFYPLGIGATIVILDRLPRSGVFGPLPFRSTPCRLHQLQASILSDLNHMLICRHVIFEARQGKVG
jgi:hypothetical protein